MALLAGVVAMIVAGIVAGPRTPQQAGPGGVKTIVRHRRPARAPILAAGSSLVSAVAAAWAR
ncbi:hypothetical protein [Luteimonas abyssi]|uniref:hypothetical protein n=1 Tax=Luteimonas abyssi TaxID=1247514 RepID=UPI000737C988|nr:hypothetical protein [Luteimonas abyssi]